MSHRTGLTPRDQQAEYVVHWSIDVAAANAREAAQQARAAQLRKDTLATVFDVFRPDGTHLARIDLNDKAESWSLDGSAAQPPATSAQP